MIKQNFHASDKVDYFTADTLATPFHKDVEILESCHQVELVDITSIVPSDGKVVRAFVDLETGVADTFVAGSAGAVTLKREANTFLLDENRTYAVGATGVAFGANSIVITASQTLPESLVGSPIRLLFNDTDANAKYLPEMMFVGAVSGTTATVFLDKITGLGTASTGAIGFQVLGDAYIKKNIPVVFTSATVTGSGALVKLKGSFPFKVVKGATVSMPSHNAVVKKKYQGTQETLRFVIENADEATGTISILDPNSYLQAFATNGQPMYAEIDKEAGFGEEFAGESTYQQSGSRTLVSLAKFDTDATVKMIQHLRG